MKQIKVYPLAKASAPPPMQFMNGSNQNIDTLFPDTLRYFELLAMLVNEEPLERFDPLERWQMQAIGIEKGKPFAPDEKTKALLSEAARIGGAIARANTYASHPATVYYYPNRKWQQMQGGLTYTFARDGAPQIDARNNVYYMAAGNTPAMMDEERRSGLAVSLDLSRCHRRVSRRREDLQAARPPEHSGQKLLVSRRLRRVQPFRVAERSAVAVGEQLRQPDDQCGRFGRHRLRPERAARRGNWIRTVPARVGSRCSASTARRGLLRQDVGT